MSANLPSFEFWLIVMIAQSLLFVQSDFALLLVVQLTMAPVIFEWWQKMIAPPQLDITEKNFSLQRVHHSTKLH